MIKRGFTFFLFCTLSAAAYIPAFGQESPARARPTVGLVLSGGGARGFAHIGVLKVLEENRVPVDYVGGASMGALIGALYAMGKTPAEIEQFVAALDWDKLFSATANFDDLSFRRKEDRRNIPAPIPLRGKLNNLQLPAAFNSGHEIGLLFDRASLPYAGVRDFDKLPIPFRVVATNMVDGRSEELKSGSLSRSLRATMAIPGVFAPVEIDGKILADGGLVNNIPTNVVKAMGADILLVVNIESQPASRESLNSLLGVLAQTINIATAENSRRSLSQADLIIAPDLKEYTSTNFGQSKEIIELGYEGAKAKRLLLTPLSLSEADWQAHLEARRGKVIQDPTLVPLFLAVDGEDRDAARTIEDTIGETYLGKPLDEEAQLRLSRDLSRLTGTGRFDSLNYDLITRDGKVGLLIRSNETNGRRSDPTRLDIGFDVNNIESESANFGISARMTFYDIGRYGAEWRNDVKLGSRTLVASEYYRPLGDTRFFMAPRVSYERRRISLFDGERRSSEYTRSLAKAGIDIGYTFNPRSQARLGYTIGRERADLRIGDDVLPDLDGRFSLVSAGWTFDSLDQSQVPSRGFYSRNLAEHYFDAPGAAGSFTQIETRNNVFAAISPRNTFFAFGGGGTTVGGNAPVLRKFALGGPFRVGGYDVDEFRADNYVHGGLGILHSRPILPAIFGGRAYVGAWYEGGSAFESFAAARYRQSVSGGVIVETPLGPILVGAGVNDRGNGKFFFSFGRFLR